MKRYINMTLDEYKYGLNTPDKINNTNTQKTLHLLFIISCILKAIKKNKITPAPIKPNFGRKDKTCCSYENGVNSERIIF